VQSPYNLATCSGCCGYYRAVMRSLWAWSDQVGLHQLSWCTSDPREWYGSIPGSHATRKRVCWISFFLARRRGRLTVESCSPAARTRIWKSKYAVLMDESRGHRERHFPKHRWDEWAV